MTQKTLTLPTEDLLALFQSTPDLVCIADRHGYFRNFNPAVPATLGYTEKELLEKPIAELIHPDDREATSNRRAKLLKGQTLLNFRNRYITKNGAIIWLEWTSVYLPERELVLAIAKNITERKAKEQQIEAEFARLTHQAEHFKSNLEKERKDVAVGLHEDMAQLATAIRVDLDWLGSNIQLPGKDVEERIEHARMTADLLVNTIRKVSFAISPAMLDDLGLDATLEWYCKEFSVSSGIDCSYESSYIETSLTKEIQLDFFRICQLALKSIKQHSKSTRVQINIKRRAKKVILSIKCNDTQCQMNMEVHSEIVGIRERVASFSGKCTIEAGLLSVEVAINK